MRVLLLEKQFPPCPVPPSAYQRLWARSEPVAATLLAPGRALKILSFCRSPAVLGLSLRGRTRTIRPLMISPALPTAASRRKLRLLPLLATVYFMVSGGPYGLEEIIGDAGYGWALVILFATPFFWSMPTALMIGELAAAIPEEGGFYAWVRRALGPFWGFQEAWLSLAASVFDMAIYPTLFVSYLEHFNHWGPFLQAGHRELFIELTVVIVATLWNLRGAVSVGNGSVVMWMVGLAPFAVLIVAAVWQGAAPARPPWRRPKVTRSWPPVCSWPCGTTWAGTTPRPSPERWPSRSAPTRG